MESPISAANSTSKVKVEYTDPSGVFPLIASEIQSRLPLRNLNWNSPGRPVRSIESLHIDLYPDEKTSVSQLPKRSASLAGLGDHGGQDQPPTPTVGESSRQSARLGPNRERRHQIPGLTRTPYLKIYLLRCDDVEIYKNSSRKLLREWIKANVPSSHNSAGSSNQENHDAFEWLIIHVVLPDPQGNTIWPSKVSASVADKVRSDFNSSSRSSTDRVAQIPATKSLQVQGSTVPGIPSGAGREPFLQESARAWDDLVGKTKGLILSSFDLRVRQYEEDIKEKGSQRNLPGWNFCTFFVLKEGLARGFESVGLVDDALAGYDELSAELLSALREEATKAASGADTRLFREHTHELLLQAEAALEDKEDHSTPASHKQLNTSIFDVNKKSYRDLILSNNISAFDFRAYVFARQVALLLRFAAQVPPGGNTGPRKSPKHAPRDPSLLAEICRRAISFIADLARLIRQDLKVSFKARGDASKFSPAARHNIIENIVMSYVYSAAKQILAKTQDPSLPDRPDLTQEEDGEDEYEDDTASLSSPKSDLFERHISSDEQVPPPRTLEQQLVTPQPKGNDFSYEQTPPNLGGRNSSSSVTMQLATRRGELFLIARRSLNAVAARKGWTRTSWHGYANMNFEEEQLDDIVLGNETNRNVREDSKIEPSKSMSPLAAILDQSMRISLSTEEGFYRTYEMLSLAAFKLFHHSQDKKSAYSITADIASLRFQTKEYSSAATYLMELAPFYAHDDWVDLEVSILEMYAFCLKKLGRKEEYVRIGLRTLAKSACATKAWGSSRAALAERSNNAARGNLESIDSLATESKSLSESVVIDMEDLFSNIQIQPYVQHEEKQDRFWLTLSFNSLLQDGFTAHEAQGGIFNSSEGQNKEIWLKSDGPVKVRSGRCSVDLFSNSMITGWYDFGTIALEVQKISIQYKCGKGEGHPAEKATLEVPARSQVPRVLLWSSHRAPRIRASVYSLIHLEQPRSIYIEIQSGDDASASTRLVLKSATAGLRLHTAEAEVVVGDCQTFNKTQPSTVSFESLLPNAKVGVKIPYKLDTDTKEIIIRSETTYETEHGTFLHGETHRLFIQLPLGVNVQDIFKEHSLFSKFAISTATGIPLRVISCELKETDDYVADTPYVDTKGLCVFSKQPVSLVYRIKPNDKAAARRDSGQRRLSMHIAYQCLDEEILSTVQNCFVESLKSSGFWKYVGLLLPHLTAALRRRLTHPELETVGLLREVRMASYSELDWTAVLSAVSPIERDGIAFWLQHWHTSNQTILLLDEIHNIEDVSAVPTRRIIIPVEIPRLHILHTASLSVAKPHPARPFTVGNAISAELGIRYTRAWCGEMGTSSEPQSFYYDLEAPSDTWLIAGRRRALFTASESESKRFPILLHPLRAGKLMLPMLEITAAKDDKRAADGRPLGCEVDYESMGVAVEVVLGMTSVTSEIEEGEVNGGVGILEVERK